MNLSTTRGCPYHCNWCAKPIYGQRYTARSPESVAREVEWLGTTYRPDHLWIADDIFGLKPGWEMASSLTGPVLSKRAAGVGGTHGHLPDLPDLRAAFFLLGPGVPAGRSLGLIDMRDVAPTLASRAGLALPGAEGKALLP